MKKISRRKFIKLGVSASALTVMGVGLATTVKEPETELMDTGFDIPVTVSQDTGILEIHISIDSPLTAATKSAEFSSKHNHNVTTLYMKKGKVNHILETSGLYSLNVYHDFGAPTLAQALKTIDTPVIVKDFHESWQPLPAGKYRLDDVIESRVELENAIMDFKHDILIFHLREHYDIPVKLWLYASIVTRDERFIRKSPRTESMLAYPSYE